MKNFLSSISSFLTSKSRVNFDGLTLNGSKYLLITILMIIHASVIQTEDEIIDGIRIRYSTVDTMSKLDINGEHDITQYDAKLIRNIQQALSQEHRSSQLP